MTRDPRARGSAPDTYPPTPTLGGVLDIPRSARLAAWGTAWLQGRASVAEVRARGHRATTSRTWSSPATCWPAAADLSGLLAGLKHAGVRALRVVLPVPGDPVGLPGPPAFNAAALEAGECVLTAGGPAWGVVPDVAEFGSQWEPGWQVTWQLSPVVERQVPPSTGLAEAERALRRRAGGHGCARPARRRRPGPEAAERLQRCVRRTFPRVRCPPARRGGACRCWPRRGGCGRSLSLAARGRRGRGERVGGRRARPDAAGAGRHLPARRRRRRQRPRRPAPLTTARRPFGALAGLHVTGSGRRYPLAFVCVAPPGGATHTVRRPTRLPPASEGR